MEATKLFLRLDDSSRLMRVAENSDFKPYQTEVLYTYTVPQKSLEPEATEGLRQKVDSDSHAIYRMYHTCVPPQARVAEGITMQDWLDCREHLHDENGSNEYLIESENEVKGWIRLCASSTSAFMEITSPSQNPDISKKLVDFALSKVGAGAHISTLVPEYSTALATSLENAGFKAGPRMVSMLRPVAVSVKETNAVPVGA
ncbi:MAG: hypothetical protein EXR59_04840 [Dehalococcoidia bacterium]|nr:hypothetical protein [Dehalococcoidia bacterium]